MTERGTQGAAGGNPDQDAAPAVSGAKTVLDVVQLYGMVKLGRQPVADRHQFVSGAGTQLGADIVVRLEAAKDETAAVDEQDSSFWIAVDAATVTAQRHRAVASLDPDVLGANACGIGITKAVDDLLVVGALLRHAGRGRQARGRTVGLDECPVIRIQVEARHVGYIKG